MDYIFLIQAILLITFFASYNWKESISRCILTAFFISMGFGIVYSVWYIVGG